MPGDVLVVNEIYGPVEQGEGRHAGRPCAFVRLSRCNLDCAWCDTPYTWDWKGKNGVPYDPAVESHLMGVAAVVDALAAHLPSPETIVVVSGGEPLIQRQAVTKLATALWPREVHVETNGTLPPAAGVAWNSVSPKLLPSAGIPLEKAYKPEALAVLAEHPGAIKLVVDPATDTELAVQVAVQMLEVSGWTRDRVDLMPCGATREELAETAPTVQTLSTALRLGYSPRLHVTVSGGGRGV